MSLKRKSSDQGDSKRQNKLRATVATKNVAFQLMNRSGPGQRIQAQFPLQNGMSGFGVLCCLTSNGTPCLQLVEPWIYRITHPIHGLDPYRMTVKAHTSVPFNIPPKLITREKRTGIMPLAAIINRLVEFKRLEACEFFDNHSADVSDEPKDEDNQLREFFHRFSDVPLPGSNITIKFKHICAQKGDVILFTGPHFNCSGILPTATLFADAFITESPEEEIDVGIVYQEHQKKTFSITAGKSNKPKLESAYYRHRREQGFIFDSMPDSGVSGAALGAIPWNQVTDMPEKPEATQQMINDLIQWGYVVVPRETFDPDGKFLELLRRAKAQFFDFFNWSIFERVGSKIRLSWKHRANEKWDILKSQASAERITGNKYFMNASKIVNGKRVYSKSSQGGCALCAISNGMGQATSAYHLPAVLRVTTFPGFVLFMWSVYEKMGKTLFATFGIPAKKIHCININPERGRVKCASTPSFGTTNYNMMPVHLDRKLLH